MARWGWNPGLIYLYLYIILSVEMEEGDSRATVISSSDKGERETDAGDWNGFRIIITFGCCILIFVMFVVVLVVLLLLLLFVVCDWLSVAADT